MAAQLNASQIAALFDGPALQPPDGTIPNFYDFSDKSISNGYSAFLIISLVISTLGVLGRCYVKACIIKSLQLDDYCMIGAWLPFLPLVGIVLHLVDFAPSFHQWDFQLRRFEDWLYFSYITTPLSNITFILLKTSILLQIQRVFIPHGTRPFTFYLLHALLWINALLYTIGMFLTAFACKPIRKSWSIFEQGKCLDVETLNLASAAGNIVTDVGIFLVPQCVIWGLRMGDWRRKARLVAVFGVGVVAIAIAAARLAQGVKMNNSPDKTYHSAIIGLLVMAELMAGFLVISLPTLPKLATTIFEKSSQATSRFGSRSSYGDAGKATKLDEKTKTETKGSDESSVRATISGVGASPRLSLDRSSFGDDPFADVLAAVPASRQAENWREVNSAGPGYMDMDLEFQTKPSYLYPEP